LLRAAVHGVRRHGSVSVRQRGSIRLEEADRAIVRGRRLRVGAGLGRDRRIGPRVGPSDRLGRARALLRG
jgi:hypothetical protein